MPALPIDFDGSGVNEILVHDREHVWVLNSREHRGGAACLSRKAVTLGAARTALGEDRTHRPQNGPRPP